MSKLLQLGDAWNLARRIGPKRFWNLLKVYSSYYYSRLLGRPKQWGLPFSISIEPTTACNLRCPECPSGLRNFSRPRGNLKADFFRTLIEEVGDQLFYLTFYFQGEPYLNPNFLEMVAYANQKGIYTATSTNAHFLNEANAKKTVESGLDRLIISIDGSDQETYSAYRKSGKLENVLQGARNMVKWKRELKSKTPYLIFQFLVVRPNEHQIPDIYRLAEEIGVDEVKLKTAQIYDYKQGNPLIPTQNKYARYAKQADGSYVIKNELLNHCWKLWHSCVISWDGRVLPCCFDKDAQHELGQLQSASFEEIWWSEAYEEFRELLFKGRDQIDICQNCTEGCKVWAED